MHGWSFGRFTELLVHGSEVYEGSLEMLALWDPARCTSFKALQMSLETWNNLSSIGGLATRYLRPCSEEMRMPVACLVPIDNDDM